MLKGTKLPATYETFLRLAHELDVVQGQRATAYDEGQQQLMASSYDRQAQSNDLALLAYRTQQEEHNAN